MPVHFSTGLIASNGALLNAPVSDGTNGQALVTDGAGQLSFADAGGAAEIDGGTAAAPGLPVVGDSDTGLFSDTADTLSIAAGGVEGLRVVESAGQIGTKVLSGSMGISDPTTLVVENATPSGDAGITLDADGKQIALHNDFSRDSVTLAFLTNVNSMNNAIRLAEFRKEGSAGQLVLNGGLFSFASHALIANDSGNGAISIQADDGFDWFGMYAQRPANDEIDFQFRDRDNNEIFAAAVRNRDDPRIGFLGATPASRQPHIADVPTGGSATASDNATAINAIFATLETYGFHATA